MRNGMVRFVAAAVAALLVVACGSSGPKPAHGGDGAEQPGAESPTMDPPPEDSPWAELDRQALAERVREGSMTALSEAGHDEATLQEWIASPEQAPRLSSEVAGALLPLVLVAFVEEDWDRVEGVVSLVRQRAENRHMAYVAADMVAEARRQQAGSAERAQRTAIRESFAHVPIPRLGEAARGVSMFPSLEVLQRALDGTYQAPVSSDSASAVLLLGHVLPSIVSRRELYMDVLGDLVESQAEGLRDTYEYPDVDLDEGEDGEPMVVGVWDVGTKASLFRDQLFVNPNEEDNGEDDDGNGQVDDVHGIVSEDAATSGWHYEPEAGSVEARERLGLVVGVQRLQSGMEFLPGAREAAQVLSQIRTPDQKKAFENTMGELTQWVHGTHVAASMLAGNPFARLAIFRSAWAESLRGTDEGPPSDEDLDAERENMQAVAEFINEHDVRVVTIGLGLDKALLVQALSEQPGRFSNAQALEERADTVQARRAQHWGEVFEACPDTLFVVGAGNAAAAVSEAGTVPASVEADNLLVVGALDPWGDWAVFTNYGEPHVDLYDRGVEVAAVVPTGDELPLTGTSQAAPLVAGLASKMLALDPSLSTAEIRHILVETADPVKSPFTGKIPNDGNALARVRSGPPQADPETGPDRDADMDSTPATE